MLCMKCQRARAAIGLSHQLGLPLVMRAHSNIHCHGGMPRQRQPAAGGYLQTCIAHKLIQPAGKGHESCNLQSYMTHGPCLLVLSVCVRCKYVTLKVTLLTPACKFRQLRIPAEVLGLIPIAVVHVQKRQVRPHLFATVRMGCSVCHSAYCIQSGEWVEMMAAMQVVEVGGKRGVARRGVTEVRVSVTNTVGKGGYASQGVRMGGGYSWREGSERQQGREGMGEWACA